MAKRRYAVIEAAGPLPGVARRRTANPHDLRLDWLSRPSVAALHDTLAGLSATPGLTPAMAASTLAPWLHDRGWINDFMVHNLAALAADPWCELPWRVQSGPVLTGLVMAQLPGAYAMLSRLDADALAKTDTPMIVFDGGISIMMLIAGSAPVIDTYVRSGPPGAPPTIAHAGTTHLAYGVEVAGDCATQQIHIAHAPRDALLLRIVLTPPGGGSRILAFDRTSGQLLADGVAAATSSRLAALLNVVGTGSTPRHCAVFEQLATHAEPFIRWQAMRRWLAADDSGAARLALRCMAGDDPDARLRALAHMTGQRIDARMLARNAA